MAPLSRQTPTLADQQRFSSEAVFQAWLVNHHIANTAYPIAHVLTTKPYRIKNSKKHDFMWQAREWVDELWLYAHVPFCEHICTFCEYTVVDPKKFHNEDIHKTYFDALAREMKMYADTIGTKSKKLIGYDIGWWTPSAVNPAYIWKLVDMAHKYFIVPDDMNISIETTPKIAAGDAEKIKAYHDMGIRRISMGVQDINPKVLEAVGRITTGEKWNMQATENIRKAWFDSFNIDIMYWLTWQNIDRVQATLSHVLGLDPEHITIYRTRYKWTKLQDKWYTIELKNIQEQYALIKAMLKEAWYHAWMGKNTFSKVPGSSGASEYLTKRVVEWTPYLGVGLGSQSYNIKTLAYNQWAGSKKIQNYLKYIYEKNQFPTQDIYHLSPEMSAGKFASVSFYFGWIDLASFQKHFGCTLEDMFYEEVQFVLQHGYMQYENSRLQLTELGNHYYNGVISLFYAGSIKQVLLDRAYEQETPSLVATKEHAEVC